MLLRSNWKILWVGLCMRIRCPRSENKLWNSLQGNVTGSRGVDYIPKTVTITAKQGFWRGALHFFVFRCSWLCAIPSENGRGTGLGVGEFSQTISFPHTFICLSAWRPLSDLIPEGLLATLVVVERFEIGGGGGEEAALQARKTRVGPPFAAAIMRSIRPIS